MKLTEIMVKIASFLAFIASLFAFVKVKESKDIAKGVRQAETKIDKKVLNDIANVKETSTDANNLSDDELANELRNNANKR